MIQKEFVSKGGQEPTLEKGVELLEYTFSVNYSGRNKLIISAVDEDAQHIALQGVSSLIFSEGVLHTDKPVMPVGINRVDLYEFNPELAIIGIGDDQDYFKYTITKTPSSGTYSRTGKNTKEFRTKGGGQEAILSEKVKLLEDIFKITGNLIIKPVFIKGITYISSIDSLILKHTDNALPVLPSGIDAAYIRSFHYNLAIIGIDNNQGYAVYLLHFSKNE